jgi:hypothetical protein
MDIIPFKSNGKLSVIYSCSHLCIRFCCKKSIMALTLAGVILQRLATKVQNRLAAAGWTPPTPERKIRSLCPA